MGLVAARCPQCGADIQLDDSREFGFCNYCGTKVMQEKIVVEHKGSIEINEEGKLQKLYKAARNALEASDDDTALEHYKSLSALDPDNWEPIFYSLVLKTSNITNGEIGNAALTLQNCLVKVFKLVSSSNKSTEDKKEIMKEIADECYSRTKSLQSASQAYYEAVAGHAGGVVAGANLREKACDENKSRLVEIANIMCVCGNCIEAYFDMNDSDCKKYAVLCWKAMIEINNEYKVAGAHYNIFNDESLVKYTTKISKYDPTYKVYDPKAKSGGCYVATAVYGSYDCPEVWTLRRFRDYSLAMTWYGRLFITLYYAISPTIVKHFGHTEWFNKMWKGKLDRMVEKLQSEGYENTPYEDKKW